MELEAFDQFVTQSAANGVVFYHSGSLDEATVASIGAVLRRRLQEEGASSSQLRKVFSTFMEMAQNILHYAAAGDDPQPGKFGALCVVRSGPGFEVLCGNYMPAAQVPRVRLRLEAVQGMEPAMVRRAYHRQLVADAADPGSKGAGLGFLTMAAISRAPIEFAFAPDPPPADGTTFLFLKASI